MTDLSKLSNERIIAPLVGQSFYRPSAGVGEWAEAALRRAEDSTPGRRSAVLTAAAWKAVLAGDLDLARARASEALRDGLPPDTPSPGWVHSALAGADSFAGNTRKRGRRSPPAGEPSTP